MTSIEKMEVPDGDIELPKRQKLLASDDRQIILACTTMTCSDLALKFLATFPVNMSLIRAVCIVLVLLPIVGYIPKG